MYQIYHHCTGCVFLQKSEVLLTQLNLSALSVTKLNIVELSRSFKLTFSNLALKTMGDTKQEAKDRELTDEEQRNHWQKDSVCLIHSRSDNKLKISHIS